uniref:Uncharacterized protein n=1 Tax=Strix occidentalis caurina TaxID=311401 RepID=A0A8D0FE77_STROC
FLDPKTGKNIKSENVQRRPLFSNCSVDSELLGLNQVMDDDIPRGGGRQRTAASKVPAHQKLLTVDSDDGERATDSEPESVPSKFFSIKTLSLDICTLILNLNSGAYSYTFPKLAAMMLLLCICCSMSEQISSTIFVQESFVSLKNLCSFFQLLTGICIKTVTLE